MGSGSIWARKGSGDGSVRALIGAVVRAEQKLSATAKPRQRLSLWINRAPAAMKGKRDWQFARLKSGSEKLSESKENHAGTLLLTHGAPEQTSK